MEVYINVLGSGRNEGYNLPAYVDLAVRGRINWPNDGSVHRIMLPRAIFRRGWGIKFGGSKFVRFTRFS